jgi:transposase
VPPAAVPVVLSASERGKLKERVRGATTPWRDRQRAQIVLAAARNRSNARIACDLRCDEGTVRKWRGRFAELGLSGLEDRPRSGRPRVIGEADRAAIVALACQLPAETGVPLSRWTGPELRREIEERGLASVAVSESSVLRILAENPVKPWRFQSWITPRDPRFEEKAGVILGLYQGFYQGEPLRPGDRVLSVDAKPSIQARGRLRPVVPPAPGRVMRVEHEYERNGALALLACYDVHEGTVTASTPKTTGIVPFMDLMAKMFEKPQYRDAPRVFVIVDNGSDHRGQASADRLRRAHPNAILVHTPVHASWLNQVEIFFSVIQKKVVSPNHFPSLEKLSETLLVFIERYNRTAKPFNWKYTADDLRDLLRRIDEHEKQDARQQSGLTKAA